MKIEDEREKKKKKRKEKTVSTKPGRIWLHAPPSDRGAAMEIQTLLWMPMLGYNTMLHTLFEKRGHNNK
jgi:hypothetical protein